MDWSLISCTTTLQDVRNHSESLLIDRLTTLPDELLIRILSLLPTKDAAVMCVLSKRMRRIFPFITTLDFDDSPISHCLKHPYAIHRFPTFVTFVGTVLQAYQSQYLTKFRFQVGRDFVTRYFQGCNGIHRGCDVGCLPDLQSTQINALISFPFTRCGLRELDFRFHVREPGDCQLPSEIFTCETLEVLRLDVNLGLDLAYTMPSFRLPNLKLLHLRAALISEDYFVTRLVSSCPLLEDLTVEACWDRVHTTSISSPSLRRLCIRKHELDIYDNSAFVSIHTPNLEYFEYYDNLALQYSIPNMDWLVKADINIGNDLLEEEFEESCWQMLNFIRPLANVQHLSLTGSCTEDLDVHGVEDQLPVFPNLKHLELGYSGYNYWDKVLLAFLNRSPLLETLIFPQGIIRSFEQEALDEFNLQSLMMEREFFRTILANAPWCCRSYLKRIVIKTYSGTDREVNLIQFLLRHASVLEELILFRNDRDFVVDHMTLESTLQNLPRDLVNCLIQVQ